MKQWLFTKGDDMLTPASGGLPYERGKQTGEGRKSDDFAMDTHPSMTDRELDAMEKARPGEAIPRELINSDPSSQSTQRGRTRLAHAAANAIDKFINGSSSDDDTAIPKIPEGDRYVGVKERQEAFMQAANEANAAPLSDSSARHSETQASGGSSVQMSPFDRYRTRMGERTGDSGMVEERLAQRELSFAANRDPAPVNRRARPSRNASVDRVPRSRLRPPSPQRLLVSDKPLTLAPPESKLSTELLAAGERTPSGHVSQRARGSLEIASSTPPRNYRRSNAMASPAPLIGESIVDSGRNESIRHPLRSIEEGRSVHEVTRVQNVRVVQPRYLIPREFVYVFGAATTLGLAIGCVTLAIGIRNANYLRGPHSNTLIPDVQRAVNNLTESVNAFAAQLGLNS